MDKRKVLLALTAVLALPAMAGDRIPIANEGGIDDKWGIASGTELAMPGYPAKYADDPRETCVAVGYLVNADGQTSDFALLNTWIAGDETPEGDYWETFANATAAAMSRWEFLPLPGVGSPQPVYTVSTFVYSSPDPVATRERCQIGNLARHLAEIGADPRNQRMTPRRSIFSRLEFDPALEARFALNGMRWSKHARPDTKAPSPPPPPSPRPQPSPPVGGG